MSYRKVGGLRFLRIGRLQLSFCICRKPAQVRRDRSAMANFYENRYLAAIERGDDTAATFWARREHNSLA